MADNQDHDEGEEHELALAPDVAARVKQLKKLQVSGAARLRSTLR
jgi:hypothetical protein